MDRSTTRPAAPALSRLSATFRRKRAADDERGYILVMTVALCMIILSLVAVALQTSVNSDAVTSGYVNNVQSRLASESGLNAATAAMAAVTSASSLPCSTSSTSGNWSYSTTITYANSSGTTLSCPPSAWPASATLTSVGSSTKAASVKMVQNMVITAPSTPVTSLAPAFNYAVFTPGGMNMSASATIANGLGANGQQADVVVGDGTDCTNGNSIGGNLYSYGTTGLSFNSSCSIGKGLYANSSVYLTNSVYVGGSVTSYGTGGISMDSSPTIGGNMTSTQGSISMSGTPTISGNAYAYGTITYNGQNVSAGAAGSNTYIKGLVSVPNTSFASNTMPTQPTFPTISQPTQAQWATSGYPNYVLVGANSTTVNGTTITQTNNYGQVSQYNYGGVSAYPSEFATLVNAATTPTVIDASACPNVGSSGGTYYNVGGSQTFSLQTNIALLVNGIALNGTNTFTSSSSTSHDMSIIVPAPDTGQIYFTNNTSFTPTLSTLLYTEGTFSANSTPSINGQILAGTPNNTSTVTITNSFALTFSNAAASTIPGTTTTTTPTTGTPTLAAVRRYVSR